jgi:serine acetyltransferase
MDGWSSISCALRGDTNIIQCLTVGAYATIGAGAVVIEDAPAHASLVGVPARVIKVQPR